MNVDLIVRVRALPRPGETVSGGTFVRAHGGKGANQASAAARLGAETFLVGLVGDDEAGREARADLDRAGVNLTYLGVGERPTGVASVIVGAGGENLIAVAPGANAEVDAALVERALAGVPEPAVVLANLEVPDEALVACVRGCGRRGFTFVLNPAPARVLPAEVLAGCRVLIPNEVEAGELGAASLDELLATSPSAIVVTRGAAGADLHRPGRPMLHHDAFRVEAVDTTGAGDAFCAAFAWALSGGRELETALSLACAAGALATRALGARASLPTRREIEQLVGRSGQTG